MNLTVDKKLARILASFVCGSFMAIHIAMLFLFSAYGVTPMAYFNVFSIIFYLTMFVFIYRELWRLFATLTFVEVVVHMTLAVFFVGWGSGFQITLIGINILLFYAEYAGHALKIRHVHAVPWSLFCMVLYLVAFAWTATHPVPYQLPAEVSFWLQIIWGFITFVVTVVFLKVFVLLAVHSEEALSEKVIHDELTGLPNRYYMTDHINEIAEEEGLGLYWIAMADIDDFKVINDTYGHNCGDYVLRALAEVIKNGVSDVALCRWGGEEFLLMGRVDGDMAAQRWKLDRLRKTVEDYTFWYEDTRIHFTITIGVAPYEAGASISEWVNRADKKLYEGKRSGKNCVML